VTTKKFKGLRSGHVYLLGFTIAIIVFCGGYVVNETWLHFKDDPAFVQNVFWIGLMLSPMLGFLAFGLTHFVEAEDFHKTVYWIDKKGRKKKKTGGEFVVDDVIGCTLLNLGINIAFNLARLKGFQIQPIEIYLFYSAISVAEEVTFRILIVNIVVGIFSIWETTRHSKIPVIIAAIISGILFSWAHWNVYHNVPEMMWATGISGFAMALYYGYTKNPLVPIVAHLVNNLIAAMFVFTASIILL